MNPRCAPSRHVLVFEPEHGGHQPAYVRMLADWHRRAAPASRVTFAVSGALLERLRSEDGFLTGAATGVDVQLITAEAAQACFTGSLARRSRVRMQLLDSLVRSTGADHVVTLYLDSLQLSLALGRRLADRARLSGILFRPSIHPIYTDTASSTLTERVRDLRKRVLYSLMFRNACLQRVMCLDPYFPAYAKEKFRTGAQIVAIPDPVVEGGAGAGGLPPAQEVADDLREAVSGDRCVLALFGALTERKGVLQVLEALERVEPGNRAKVRIVLAGRIESAIQARVRDRVAEWARRGVDSGALRVVDRYLSTPELSWLVARSAVILAPYQRFVGSSGVLTWAAAHGRPVIGQSYGLVGTLIREFRLGLAVDCADPTQIAAGIDRLADPARRAELGAHARWTEFLEGRTADRFAAAVLGEALTGSLESP